MKNLSAIITVLILSSGALAQGESIGSFQFEERSSNHIAKIVIKTRTFVGSNHTLTFADEQYLRRNQISLAKGVSILTRVDGRKPLGTDADCYNPHFQNDTFAAKLSDNGESLLLFMAGSDAAGSYQIMWTLRKDGHHSRFINDCSDCDYSGVLDFFMKQ